MEESRLRPMPENYDEKLFNQIYKDTDKLRKKLAWQIDARRLGVDTKEILSWFDVKFIHAFGIYHDKFDPELLKAHIIKSLSFFKCRILRFCYSEKAKLHNTVDIEGASISYEMDHKKDHEVLINLAMTNLRTRLSVDAYQVLCTEIHTPLYIISQLAEKGKPSNTQIPSRIIAEYLGWNDRNCIKRVCQAREEIRNAIVEAREYFSQVEV